MKERYLRNLPALTEQEQQQLSEKHVLIIGCGGLGGFLCEYLVRLGVGEITAVDPDLFDESNLNRQLLSSTENLGKSKALAAKQHAAEIDPELRFHAVEAAFCADNAAELLSGKDLVLDALDSASARLLLEDACAEAGVTLVHGAIHGWTVQASVVPPGRGILHQLYGSGAKGDTDKACLVFTPAYCAAVQAAEAVKLLVGRPSALEGKLLIADLQTMDTVIIPL